MPTPTYTPLATVTLGSSASSVTFSSIPATYRDLILIVDQAAIGSGTELRVRLNSDSGSNYSRVLMFGNGSTASSASYTGESGLQIGPFGTVRATTIFTVMDYSATDKHKTVLSRADSTDSTRAVAARWANTAAVTTVLVGLADGGNFSSASTFNLYGVIA